MRSTGIAKGRHYWRPSCSSKTLIHHSAPVYIPNILEWIRFFSFFSRSQTMDQIFFSFSRSHLGLHFWMLFQSSKLKSSKVSSFLSSRFLIFFGLESTQIACRVQPKRAQVEAQYWGNTGVARLEGTLAILFWIRHLHRQIYKQTRNRTEHTSVVAI